MSFKRPSVLLVALVGGGILLSGCAGTEIDALKAEGAIRFDVQRATDTKIKSVDCPSGVEVEPGTRFTCQVLAVDGSEAVAELEILNDEADVRMIRLTKA
ncbi:MAG: DUF4333 domain-containing protein [Solirubrobacterales bacterium]